MDGSRPQQISGAPGGTQPTGTRLNGDPSDDPGPSPSRKVRLQAQDRAA
ncbi:hypothetical protein chiPu_0033263, partial [Chiloscyllium punctatum]|nr:hypothetical protein [Chiloscyllium punctatum]